MASKFANNQGIKIGIIFHKIVILDNIANPDQTIMIRITDWSVLKCPERDFLLYCRENSSILADSSRIFPIPISEANRI